jgi:hypothetical protein
VVVRIDVDLASGDEDEGRIDVDWELDVSVLIPVDLKLRLLLIIIEGLIIFLFLILYFFLDNFVDFTQPFHPSQYLGFTELHLTTISDSILIDMVKNALIVNFAFNEGEVIFRKSFILLLDFLQEYFEIILLHKHD